MAPTALTGLDADKLIRQYYEFASTIEIPTKDEGVVRYKPYGTQRYLIEQLLRGICAGIHEFVIVKPRQVGASTAMLTFDAYWMLRNRGLQGLVVADADDNKEIFRDTFSSILRTLPPKFSYPMRANNRNLTAWTHGSRLAYRVAGTAETKRSKRLGRSLGVSFIHATEVAFWGDQAGFKALRGSMSERHPAACYVWESTANGYNFFYDVWDDAQRAVTIKPIFLAWWMHELYEAEETSKVHQVYWDGRLTSEEEAWQHEISARYGVVLRPTHWSWYRWKMAEKMGNDQQTMHQEFPTLPEHAFQASGQSFLGAPTMAKLHASLTGVLPPETYRYVFGPLIEQSNLVETSESMAQLKVWEPPKAGEHYVISGDPSFAANPDSDNAVAQVWKASRDKLVQVAEFCSNELTLQQFAWVLCHLTGIYYVHPGQSYMIVELNGPGMAVWQEIQRLLAWGFGTARQPQLLNVLAGVQHYIFRRADSMRGQGAWQWKTTPQTKSWIMNRLRDQIMSGNVICRSQDLVKELSTVRQSGDLFAAHGRAHDDRALAAAMGVEQWAEQVSPYLNAMPMSDTERQESSTVDPLANPTPVAEVMLASFFHRLGQA